MFIPGSVLKALDILKTAHFSLNCFSDFPKKSQCLCHMLKYFSITYIKDPTHPKSRSPLPELEGPSPGAWHPFPENGWACFLPLTHVHMLQALGYCFVLQTSLWRYKCQMNLVYVEGSPPDVLMHAYYRNDHKQAKLRT